MVSFISRVTLRTPKILLRRLFFASSTDHTRLLAEAQVHRFELDDGRLQYVLAAGGSDVSQVRTIPMLHLARLFVENDILQGAKVVNRTLGKPIDVCGKLVETALKDHEQTNMEAYANLHGLVDWAKQQGYNSSEEAALEFVKAGQSGEALLYQAHGASLQEIVKGKDTSEFADTSGGAVALMKF